MSRHKQKGDISIGFIESYGDFSIYGVANKHAAQLAVKEINDGFTLLGGPLNAPGIASFAKSTSTAPVILAQRDKLKFSNNRKVFNIEKVLFAEEDKILVQSGDSGILGRPVKLIAPDCQSPENTLEKMTTELIEKQHVDLVVGGFQSTTREQIRPIIDKFKQLYFYTNQYEGGVADKYTFCTGAVCEQQVLPLLQYMTKLYGPRIFIIAADYKFGRLTSAWTKCWASMFGGKVIGEKFQSPGDSDFDDVIAIVKKADPDWIMTLIVGEAQQNFYPQAYAANLNYPMASTISMASGYEHIRFSPPALNKMHNAVNYMMEIPTTRNIAFVKRWFNLFPADVYIGQMAQNTYVSIHLYAKAARLAGSVNQQKVIKILESGLHIEAPEGSIFLDPATHHLTHYIRLAAADEYHNIKFVQEWPTIDPWWLRRLGVNLVHHPEYKQYTPDDDTLLCQAHQGK
jgi:branched-chain amino acid transport system substrate-binding protein